MSKKSTINLGDVLSSLTSPMEKVANMKEGSTDAMESKSADAGHEESVEGKESKKGEGKESKKSEALEAEGKDKDYEKEMKDKEYKDKMYKDKEYKEKMEKEASSKSIQEAAAGLKKTASEVVAPVATETPVSGLEKIAHDLAEVEHKTMVKEASVFGSVMADSFANRLAEIQTVVDASEAPTMDKTAMEKNAHDEYMTKVATELFVNMADDDKALVNEMVKVAADQGMQISPEEAFSALADEAVTMGHNSALEKIAVEEGMTKLAAEDHAQLEGFVKTAALMGEEMTKEDAFTYLSKQAMEQGAEVAKTELAIEKTAAENVDSELVAMEKVASEMQERGDTEGVASLEKYAYEKGFEATLVKVAAHTSSIGYGQTEELMK